MAEHQIRFDDEVAYERMMGAWSRLAGGTFLDWIVPRPGDGFRLMVRPARAFYEMTLVGGCHAGVGLRGSRSGCRIADDTGEVDAQGIARSDQVRFTLDNGPSRLRLACPFGANKRLMRRSKHDRYSITSSARCWRDRGTSRSSAFAVLRLMTSSYVVGNWTGRSAGFAPFKI